MGDLASRFPKMIEELNSDNDIVVLSRYVKGGGDHRIWLRRTCSKFFNLFCRSVLGTPIKDFTSSIFLMKRNIINEVTILGYGHGEFFIEFLYNSHKKGFKIKEIPHIQKKDDDIANSKTAPGLVKFIYHGTMYFLRVFSSIIRRKN